MQCFTPPEDERETRLRRDTMGSKDKKKESKGKKPQPKPTPAGK